MKSVPFDPNLPINSRQGDPMKFDGHDMTVGLISIFALDNVNLDKCDKAELRRRDRMATELQDALERNTTVFFKKDEIDLIEDLVMAACKRMNNGTLVYGQFDRLLAELKDAKPNGKGIEPQPEA